jgi:spermidine synthase
MKKKSPTPDTVTSDTLPSLSARLLLLVLFLGSGCSALIYEIVWLEMLQLVIGSTAVSLGVLLGTFMGGMCVGSLLLARVISRRRHPLRVYAVLELGIGALAIGVLYGMPHIEAVYAGAAGAGWATSLALRGLVSMACLLAPTILMGATLPAISRWIRTTPEGISWLGFFYGGNIAGAVVGCLLAGFCLLRTYDVATATEVAVLINLAVATLSLALSRVTPYRPEAAPPPATSAAPPPRTRIIYIAIALSGLTALGAEVIWTRLLSLLLGGTVYTFSIILAVFLLGLGLGSVAGSLLARTARPRLALGCCQLLLGAAIAWTAYALAHSLPYWPINPDISTSPWVMFQADLARCLWAVLPATVLWGASFPLALAAAAGPGKDPGRLVGGVYAANTVGAIAGALAFSLVLIPAIGTQDSQRILLALSAISALILLAPQAWALRLRTADRRRAGGGPAPALVAAVGLVAALGLAGLLAWSVPPSPWAAVGFGRHSATWIPQIHPGVLDAEEVELLRKAEAWRITLHVADGAILYEPRAGGEAGRIWLNVIKPEVDAWIAAHRAELLTALGKGYRPWGEAPSSAAVGGGAVTRYCTLLLEGMNISVAVSESNDHIRYFHGAGKVQASSHPQDMRLQRMLGHLSMLARPDPDTARSVLVVGCGAGVTAGTFVSYDALRRIVICDIEPIVPQFVAPLFARENHDVVNDPRTQVIADDGRHFVHTTREKFDVITSDPIDPWVKGCAALSTREYYEMCKAHLNPGGIMTVWLPLYESDEASVKSAIATFFEVFPSGRIWGNDSLLGGGYDVVLFAQADPAPPINVDRLQDWLDRHPKVTQSLAEVGFGDMGPLAITQGEFPEASIDLLATYAGQAADLTEWTRGAAINTDRNLRLQYLAGMAVNNDLGAPIFKDMLLYWRFPEDLFAGSPERLATLRQAMKVLGRHPALRTAGPAATSLHGQPEP